MEDDTGEKNDAAVCVDEANMSVHEELGASSKMPAKENRKKQIRDYEVCFFEQLNSVRILGRIQIQADLPAMHFVVWMYLLLSVAPLILPGMQQHINNNGRVGPTWVFFRALVLYEMSFIVLDVFSF